MHLFLIIASKIEIIKILEQSISMIRNRDFMAVGKSLLDLYDIMYTFSK